MNEPDGWVLVVPLQGGERQVVAFKNFDHAQSIADGFPDGFVKPEPIYFVPDERFRW